METLFVNDKTLSCESHSAIERAKHIPVNANIDCSVLQRFEESAAEQSTGTWNPAIAPLVTGP